MTVTAKQVITAARRYRGVRYRHQGDSRHGCDCWGLVRATCKDLGLFPNGFNVPRDYGRIGDGELQKKVEEHCGAPVIDAVAGCLVLISWPGAVHAGHLAFFTGENLIHSYSRMGKVVEHGFRAPWTKLVHGFYKLPGVIYG